MVQRSPEIEVGSDAQIAFVDMNKNCDLHD
jgi:hypothetical protein